MSTSYDFSGKKVLVTGASQGIGRGIVEGLIKAGAHVFALARNADALSDLANELNNVTVLVGDVTAEPEELRKLLEPHQPFHGLVNNAGIGILEPVMHIKADSITKVLDVNLKAPILISQLVAEEMQKHKIHGSIVNISSQGSLRPIFDHTVYCASKAGLDMATRCMAKELGRHSIRVNCVNPTVVMTALGRKNWSEPAKASVLLDQMPIRKFAELEDVTKAVLFLLSDASALTTGAAFPVDGGFTTQ